MDDKKIHFIVIVILAIIAFPIIVGYLNQNNLYMFGGFLLNPIDGNSYIAKMYEGWNGSWTFTLPYSPEKGEGAYIFLFYLLLGHIARWLNLPLVLVFQFARLTSALFFYCVLWEFIKRIINDSEIKIFAFILCALGSGIGWLVSFFGKLPMDFWIAEAYPFLSVYVNPHFPLSLSLILKGILLFDRQYSKVLLLQLIVIGFVLANLLPFGFVILGLLLFVKFVLDSKSDTKKKLINLAFYSTAGFPIIIYQFILTRSNTLLAEWNLQNQTPAPDILNLILSLSPAVILAFICCLRILKKKVNKEELFLVIWLVLAIILTYLPFNLQRRFLLGIYIPTSLLAMIFLKKVGNNRSIKIPASMLIFSSLISNTIVIVMGIVGILSHQPLLFQSKSEFEGLKWIEVNTPKDTVVLTNSRLGMFLPAYTGRRVIYGHPFESIRSEENKPLIEQFFSCQMEEAEAEDIIRSFRVKYVFWSDYQNESVCLPEFIMKLEPALSLEYQSGSIKIYAIH